MNRQNIVKKLMIEGFSEKTLVGLSDKQLVTLSRRILKEQDEDENHKGIPHVKSGSPDELNMKNKGKSFVTYEEEMKECDNKLPGLSVKGSKTPKKSAVKQNDVEDNKPHEDDINEKDEGIKKPLSKKARFKEFLEKKNGVKKVVDKKKSVNLAKNKKEVEDIKEWVDQLVQTEKSSITTKDEIMELINLKLREQMVEPDVAEPIVKPDTDKPTRDPDRNPGKKPYHDPWKTPGIGPDPEPKMEKGNEVGDGLPDWLTFDTIISSVNESKLDEIAKSILQEIKKSVKPNLNEVVASVLRKIKNQ